MNDNLRRMDDARMDKLEKEFDGFRAQYVKNGKELVRMSDAIDRLGEIIGKHMKTSEDFQKEVKPMLEWFVGMKFTRRLVLGLVGLTGLVTGILLGIKKLL